MFAQRPVKFFATNPSRQFRGIRIITAVYIEPLLSLSAYCSSPLDRLHPARDASCSDFICSRTCKQRFRCYSKRASGCIVTISSLDDVNGALDCTTVKMNGFTSQGFELDLADDTTVNLDGDVLFENKS
ncbi:hypothetical protein ACEPAF_7497 [Sanghuangporus sanghuang]